MKRNFMIFFMFFVLGVHSNSTQEVKYVVPLLEEDKRDIYYIDLLKFIFEKISISNNEYILKPLNMDISKSRIIEEVKEDRLVTLTWAMTSKEREEELLPIRIPILKGLLSHRIFIIKKGTEKNFETIKTIDDLKKLRVGQGRNWSDTKILKNAGIEVITASVYANLFQMLLYNRFDYFPRGVNEPWSEVENFGNGELVVEKKLLIKYPAPVYFFVNKKNKELAKKIEDELNKTIDDGSFDNFFYNHPQIKEMFKLSNISNRRIFEIVNPLLSEKSINILHHKKYWYTQGDELKHTQKD